MKNRLIRRRNLGILTLAFVTALLANPLPAYADVDSVTGGGFAAFADVLGLVLVPHTPGGPGGTLAAPGVNFTATEPADGFDEDIPGVAVSLPNVLAANLLNVSTEAQGVASENHAASVTTTSSVANVTVGPTLAPGLTADVISSTCTSNGDGSTGSTSVVNLDTPASDPITNTFSGGPVTIQVPGIATIIINEQVEFNQPGATAIVVNAVHITLLGDALNPAIEIILGQSRCSAIGPDVNIPTGNVAVTKDAPADAQDVEFSFTITCPNVPGSPFTRTVTGSGTTDPVTGLTPGTVCTVSEVPEPGFVAQPNQTLPPVTSGSTQTVTFVNQRAAADTGSIAVVKQAPADAQNVTFTFNISCPGVAGSPFTRSVTGSATTTAVTGVPVGTVCTAAESPTAGFVDQPNQNFPAVVANTTQTVTFFNQRVGDDTGQVAVVKQAPADAQNVTFTFTITCPGVAGSPFTRTVTGSATTTAVTGIPAGTVCTVSESATSGFVDQPSQTFPAATAGTTQTRTFVNTRTTADAQPDIDIEKTASPTSLPEPGGTVTFTIRVTNRGSQSVTIQSLNDDVHGDLNGRGSCATGTSLAAGQVFTCTFSVEFFGFAGASETDRVTVTARDASGRTVTDTSNSVTVTIVPSGFVPQTPFILLLQPEDRAGIIVSNNNSSSSSSSAAASAGGTSATATGPVPAAPQAAPPATAPQQQLLARTGINSLALIALAMLLVVAGSMMMSGKPGYGEAGGGGPGS